MARNGCVKIYEIQKQSLLKKYSGDLNEQ